MKKFAIVLFVLCILTLPYLVSQQAADPKVKAVEQQLLQAKPLPLSAVRLTGGPLKRAQDADAKYLLELEPDRMLAYYRERAGLTPKAKGYTGWDGAGRQLTGHIAGHYLSAVSLMYAATGDARFKERADYIVKEFKEVQDKHGDGYLSALEKGRETWEAVAKGDIRSGGFDLNGLWSPWYTLHKTYAGLRDAYRYTGNRLALEEEIKYAAWAEGILSKLTDAQNQRMLNTEFGGMGEVMSDLYADTGDKRWLNLSYKFEHRAFVDPLKNHIDNLAGRHGNMAIPQLIAAAARFSYTGKPADLMGAGFFWDTVVQHHSYVTGGHGLNEYWGEADKFSEQVDGRTNESCNIYNMLKLTRKLFALRPEAHYADFQERALYNHVLASIDPETARMCYMVPVGRAEQHEYQNMQQSFTCCVGSGMESHALHGDGIYYESGDKLYVTIYAPSTADWAAAGVKLQTDTEFPEGETATLKITARSPKEFTLAVRRPWWAIDGFAMKVNGEAVPDDVIDPMRSLPAVVRGGNNAPPAGVRPRVLPRTSTFVELKRVWKTGDTVEVKMPKTLRLEATPDNPRIAAVMWGPIVLAGNLGEAGPRGGQRGGQSAGARGAAPQRPIAPVLVAAEQPVTQWVKPVADKPGQFRTEGVGRLVGQSGDTPSDVDLAPFYRLHGRTYSVYWDLFTPPEWEKKQAAYSAEQERQRKLEAATVSFAQPGTMQPGGDFNYQAGDGVQVQYTQGRSGRRAATWFSIDVPVEQASPMAIVVTYFSDEQRRVPLVFEVQVNGQRIAEQKVERSTPARFYDVQYAIPAELVRGKDKVTVRFQAAGGSEIATVFGVRMVRANAAR